MSKSCVAPLKVITFPKLELMAAIIATQLMQFVISSLCFQPTDLLNHIHMWTDGQIALHWIYKQSPLFHTMSRRLSEHSQQTHGPLHHLLTILLIC